jgi:phosphatidate cytidylyltransferase
MLKQRVITALVLLGILLPALFNARLEYWWGLCVFLMAAGAWEWGRLNAQNQTVSVLLAGLCAFACVWAWDFGVLKNPMREFWLGLSLLWLIGGAVLLRAGPGAWSRLPVVLRLPLGLLALWGTWVAVAQARAVGINFLLSAMVLVWAADVAAYFAGRGLGGRFIARKLAVTISPGKTWEGALGGAAGVLLLAWVWPLLDRALPVDSLSLFSRLQAVSAGTLVLAALGLSAMSVVGDLIESLVKRCAGMKDSSHLLPGHGGVLDRVDALLPTMPMAMMLYAWTL